MNITRIDLHSSGIITICDEYFEFLAEHGKVDVLNLTNNSITTLGTVITKVSSLETAYLGGNPIHCTCDILWLTDWLVNFTTPSGEKVVRDYEKVTCYGGEWDGTSVYKLDPMEMGCYPVLTKLVDLK